VPDDDSAGEPRLRTVAAVLAGGVGTRSGLEVPKQLAEVGSRSILEHAVAAFDAHPDVDEVLVLMAPSHVDAARAVVESGGFGKVGAVLEGGTTRSDTTRRALEWLGSDECNLLLHDAARPLVTARIIGDCVRALDHYDAVGVAVPATDTVFEVGPDGAIVFVPDRARLWRAQTPQGFKLSVIRRAHELAAADPGFQPTDDCSVVLRYLPDVPVGVVRGEDGNLKVTTAVDLQLAELLWQEGDKGR
jgi:2-C-methyl-D-erythritol 4-phosphate cytidylyltransferase